MSGYSTYMSLGSTVVKTAGSSVDKRERRTPEFRRKVISSFLALGANKTIEGAILADELAWENDGCRMYFPENPALLQMLWKAHMDVRLEDIDLPSLPRAMAFSWPKCLIDGVELSGCLLWWGNLSTRLSLFTKFGQKYMGGPAQPMGGIWPKKEEIMLDLSYPGASDGEITPLFRCSIPESVLRDCLRSDVDFSSKLRMFNDGYVEQVFQLTPEEYHRQYVTMKMAIRMLVYIRACPDSVRDGFPENRRAKEFMAPWDFQLKPSVIKAPPNLTHHGHGSPVAHWRTCHFRSYPVKEDGTRKVGVVFVNGALVNGGEIDPKTVVKTRVI